MSEEFEKDKLSQDSNDRKEFERPEEEFVPEELRSILSDPEIPKDKKQQIVKAVLGISIRKASSFSGPIPPPELLRGYNEVVSNGAERIMSMAENQSSHRIQMEQHVVKEELKQSRLGQIFGFIIGVLGMGLATVLAFFGHEVIAGIFGTTTIVGLVTVFVLGKKMQQKETTEKH